MTDELDALDDSPEQQQQAIETAAGAVHFWRGKKLSAFSFERQAAFERLGLTGRGTFSTVQSAVAIVYLCTLGGDAGEERIERTYTAPDVKKFRAEMAAWAKSQGITMNNQAGKDCDSVAMAIWSETAVSTFTPDPGKHDTPSPNA